MSMHERRREPRVETDLNGFVVGQGAAGNVVCRVANLSRSGALAVSSRPLPEMTQVQIEIPVEHGSEAEDAAFRCVAAVVRCDRRADGRYDVGLFFTSMTPADRAVLEELLRAKPIVPAS